MRTIEEIQAAFAARATAAETAARNAGQAEAAKLREEGNVCARFVQLADAVVQERALIEGASANLQAYLSEQAHNHRVNVAASKLRVGRGITEAFADLAIEREVAEHGEAVIEALGATLQQSEAELQRLKTQHNDLLHDAGLLSLPVATLAELAAEMRDVDEAEKQMAPA